MEFRPCRPLGLLLKEQELADILAYLQTLTTPPKDGVTVPGANTQPIQVNMSGIFTMLIGRKSGRRQFVRTLLATIGLFASSVLANTQC